MAIKSPPGSQAIHVLFLLDLNGFKQVNDVYGHPVGDEVLTIVAQRLVQAVREIDLVARFGGDEFAVLAQHLLGLDAAAAIAQHMLDALEAPIVMGSATHRVGAGIGIAVLGIDGGETLRRADVALYRAKSERRSAFRFFSEDMDRLVREGDRLRTELLQALDEGKVQPAFRPTVDLRTERIVSFEATPCWVNAKGESVPHARLIQIAEESGLLRRLADDTLRQACMAAASWPDDVSLAINVYPGQFANENLSATILDVLAGAGLNARRLEVEIVESAVVEHTQELRKLLSTLRSAGAKIVLDNFGTGYSTLYHLREFHLDKIKIDPSFVDSADPQARRLLAALAGLGHGLGLAISADGLVESGQHREMLLSGIQQGQGDAFGRELSAVAALEAIAKDRQSPKLLTG